VNHGVDTNRGGAHGVLVADVEANPVSVTARSL
jgi:hypothetical protein